MWRTQPNYSSTLNISIVAHALTCLPNVGAFGPSGPSHLIYPPIWKLQYTSARPNLKHASILDLPPETSGVPPSYVLFNRLLELTDLFLLSVLNNIAIVNSSLSSKFFCIYYIQNFVFVSINFKTSIFSISSCVLFLYELLYWKDSLAFTCLLVTHGLKLFL